MDITFARHSLQYARFLHIPLHGDHGRNSEQVARLAPQAGRVKRLSGSEASQAAIQNAHAAENYSPGHPLLLRLFAKGRRGTRLQRQCHRPGDTAGATASAEHTTTARAFPLHCLGGPVPFATAFPHASPPTPFVPVPLFFPPTRLLLYPHHPVVPPPRPP